MKTHVVLPAALLAVLAGCRSSRPEEAQAPAAIAVARPRVVQAYETVAVSGSLTSQGAPSLVAFLVPGRVLTVQPREGEPVHKGQVLASLDSVSLTHALEAAHAQVEAARAGSVRAEEEFRRMKQLFESRSLAPNDFDKFKAAHEAASQQLQQALAGEGIARKNLAEARLQAPVAGFISRRLVEPGVMVAAGQPAFEIAALDPMEVQVGIPETDIRLVKVGQAAEVKVPALQGRTFKGLVKVVGVSADPASRTYMARVAVPNPGHELKVGMVAEVSITGTVRRDMTVVPTEAVVRDPQGATMVFQFYPDQKRVYAKRVEVGVLLGREVQIRSGLKGDEQVVVAGQHALRNGMPAELAR